MGWTELLVAGVVIVIALPVVGYFLARYLIGRWIDSMSEVDLENEIAKREAVDPDDSFAKQLRVILRNKVELRSIGEDRQQLEDQIQEQKGKRQDLTIMNRFIREKLREEGIEPDEEPPE